MSAFTDKAFTKLQKMSSEEVRRLVENQNRDLAIRNAVLSDCGEGYFAVSQSGRLIYVNSTVCHLLPVLVPKKYSGLSVDRFIKNSDVLDFVKKCIAGCSEKSECFFDIPDIRNEELTVRVSSFFDRDMSIWIFTVQDFTLFRKFKEQYKKNESLAALTTMAAGVAHEIKNPLASISIYLQMLQMRFDRQESVTKEEAQKSLSIMKDEIDRINRIAVDFSFAVKPMNAILANININDVVDKTIELFGVELEENNTKLTMHKASSLPKVRADASLVEQAILNLLKNAQQAIQVMNRPGSIEISTFTEGGFVKLSVEDNGCGMSDAQKNRIFEPYFTTKESGTGLGLTLLFKIMKEHDGDISVESHEGKGSVFTLQFPVPRSERYRIDG